MSIKPGSDKDRIRDILRSSYPVGLCSLALYQLGFPNGRTRVGELRDDEGLDIETVPCVLSRYHPDDPTTPGHVRYVWHFNPRPGAQLTLPLGPSVRRTANHA